MNIHYYLIINEQASSGNGRKVARKVIQQLKQQELKYTALYTDYAGHEKELTKELAETTLLPWSEDLDVSTFPILVVLGGDGNIIIPLTNIASPHTTIASYFFKSKE